MVYLLLYLPPPIPSENLNIKIVLRPRPLTEESKAPECYKGPDELIKIVLVPKNYTAPIDEPEMCGVDPTVDEGRLLGEWNSASIFTFFNTRSSNAGSYHNTTVFEVVRLDQMVNQLLQPLQPQQLQPRQPQPQ